MKVHYKPIGAVACTAFAAAGLTACGNDAPAEKPNVILIYIDDMGYSDTELFGGNFVSTPNMDRIGEEGIVFTQYYTCCPISSPSRVGVTTGMYPTRWGITTYLNDKKTNRENLSEDYLNPAAPTLAKSLKAGGYTTGHFGKWHMGGGRDVTTPPSIAEYGFDEWTSTWESPDPDPLITASDWIWSERDSIKRWERTAYFVDKTLDFLARHKGTPCYVNLWPDDMHTPYVPSAEALAEGKKAWKKQVHFEPVLAELDRQLGRLLDGLDSLGIADNTIVIFTSDNGPDPSYQNARTHGMRGQKRVLYEGGIRMPFEVRWPARIAPGSRNEETVICAADIFPTICALAGVEPQTEGYTLDGQDQSRTFLGLSHKKRKGPLFWEFGRHFVGTEKPEDAWNNRSPNILMRQGDWKLLVNYDGTETELYNIKDDINETQNLAEVYKKRASRMQKKAIAWFESAFRGCCEEMTEEAAE